MEIPEKFADIVSKIEKMNVLDLSELVKVLEEKFGVSAAMPVMMAGGGAGAGEAVAAVEKTSWNVELKTTGEQKIAVIKVLREATGLGLKEAKDIADAAPKMVKEGLKKEEAEELKKKLEDAGATVELK
jgi:large subunit ribosomal protein L7/L12